MTRKIKFRGLRVDNGKWVYGSLVNNAFFNSETKESIPYIFNTEECDNAYGWEDFDDDYGYYEVIPESVGQFTGLKDKNGTEIYEGDLVKFYTVSRRKHNSKGIVEEVIYSEDGCIYPFRDDEYIQDEQGDWFDSREGFEIVGNIHEKQGGTN